MPTPYERVWNVTVNPGFSVASTNDLIIISRELMKTLISIANDYIETSDWKTITALKFCLLSLGVIAGMQVRGEHRKPVTKCALTVFLATYIPLMAKLIRICIDWKEAE